MLLGASSPSPEPSPKSSEGYVRLCSSWQKMTEAEVAATIERSDKAVKEMTATGGQTQTYVAPTDAQLVDATRSELAKGGADLPPADSVTAVRVAARRMNELESSVPGWPQGPGETAAMHLDTKAGPTWLLVRVNRSGIIDRFSVVPPERLAKGYSFMRFMSAYALFNDLMASDNEVPRLGCARYFRLASATFPEPAEEVARAALTEPKQDPALLEKAHSAYQRYQVDVGAISGPEGDLTRETLRKLGHQPAIRIVYRDADDVLNTHTEFDVVRLSGNSGRSYAILTVDGLGMASIATGPLCVVGDVRCAQYYGWP